MNIIAADDERIVLQALVETIEEALPDANVQGFGKGSDAVEFARNNFCAACQSPQMHCCLE